MSGFGTFRIRRCPGVRIFWRVFKPVKKLREKRKQSRIQLTDQQVLEIFFYATRGPRSLAAFRGGKSGGNMDDGEAVRDEAQQHAGNS